MQYSCPSVLEIANFFLSSQLFHPFLLGNKNRILQEICCIMYDFMYNCFATDTGPFGPLTEMCGNMSRGSLELSDL